MNEADERYAEWCALIDRLFAVPDSGNANWL